MLVAVTAGGCKKNRIACRTDAECEELIIGKWHRARGPRGMDTRFGYCENRRYVAVDHYQLDTLSLQQICTLSEPDTTYFFIDDFTITHYYLDKGDTVISDLRPLVKLTKSYLKFYEDDSELRYYRPKAEN